MLYDVKLLLQNIRYIYLINPYDEQIWFNDITAALKTEGIKRENHLQSL